MSLPGWNSLQTVKDYAAYAEVIGLVALALVFIFELVELIRKKGRGIFEWLALLALGFLAIADIAAYKYNHRKEALYDEQLSKAQQQATSAQSRLDALIASQIPRTLNTTQVRSLKTELSKYRNQPVRINFTLGDTESQIYASQFHQLVKDAGWQGFGPEPQMFTFNGVAIGVSDPTAVPKAAEAMAKWKSTTRCNTLFRQTGRPFPDSQHIQTAVASNPANNLPKALWPL